MNILEIKKAIRDNLRLKKLDLERGSEQEMLLVNRITRRAEDAIKTARENQPGTTRAEAWARVRARFLTAPEDPVPNTNDRVP